MYFLRWHLGNARSQAARGLKGKGAKKPLPPVRVALCRLARVPKRRLSGFPLSLSNAAAGRSNRLQSSSMKVNSAIFRAILSFGSGSNDTSTVLVLRFAHSFRQTGSRYKQFCVERFGGRNARDKPTAPQSCWMPGCKGAGHERRGKRSAASFR